jgi:hypothetical protein
MPKTEDWPFDQPQNAAAITTRLVIANGLPILCVTHYSDDHSWAFVCGTAVAGANGRVVSMSEALEIDSTLREVADCTLSQPPKGGKSVSPLEPLELEEIVLKLDLPTRAALAAKLLRSLDDLSEEENQALWLAEARRRREELASGKVHPLDGEKVLQRLEAELQ